MPSRTRGAGRPVAGVISSDLVPPCLRQSPKPPPTEFDNSRGIVISTYETVVERHLDGIIGFVLLRRVYYRNVSYSQTIS